MFVKFITSKLLRVIVCAAAGLYGLYNAISCFVLSPCTKRGISPT